MKLRDTIAQIAAVADEFHDIAIPGSSIHLAVSGGHVGIGIHGATAEAVERAMDLPGRRHRVWPREGREGMVYDSVTADLSESLTVTIFGASREPTDAEASKLAQVSIPGAGADA